MHPPGGGGVPGPPAIPDRTTADRSDSGESDRDCHASASSGSHVLFGSHCGTAASRLQVQVSGHAGGGAAAFRLLNKHTSLWQGVTVTVTLTLTTSRA